MKETDGKTITTKCGITRPKVEGGWSVWHPRINCPECLAPPEVWEDV